MRDAWRFLDYKSDGLYMDSNGKIASGHKFYRESQKKLTKAQRKWKNKKIGSKNYEKQKLRIARIYRHTANQRFDYLHKLSTEIANQYDIVCVENLNMKFWNRYINRKMLLCIRKCGRDCCLA